MCPHGSSSPPRAVASQRSKGALASRRPRKKRLFQVTTLMVFECWFFTCGWEVRTGLFKHCLQVYKYKNPLPNRGVLTNSLGSTLKRWKGVQWGSAFAWGNWLSLQVEIKHIKDFSRPPKINMRKTYRNPSQPTESQQLPVESQSVCKCIGRLRCARIWPRPT